MTERLSVLLVKQIKDYSMKDITRSLEDQLEVNEVELQGLQDFMDSNIVLQSYLTKGLVLEVTSDYVKVDAGVKSESLVSINEFTEEELPQVGDIIDIYVDRYENKAGTTVLSYIEAKRKQAWKEFELLVQGGENPTGTVVSQNRGGYMVDFNGVLAFMPITQASSSPIKFRDALIGFTGQFKVLLLDSINNKVTVSRKVLMNEENQAQKSELMKKISVGDVVKGIVKNITEYGAFIDLGGFDGLLHVTDMSWKRVQSPRGILDVGDEVEVKVINIDQSANRISLGMKQLVKEPWEYVDNYKEGDIVDGTISNVIDYGAFVSLEHNLEGLVYITEISWTHKNILPSSVFKVGDKVKVKIIEINNDKHRINLSYKKAQDNPWTKFSEDYSIGDKVSGKVKNVTEFGIFISLTKELDGMIHISDLSWDKKGDEIIKDIKSGDDIEAKIMTIDIEKEQVNLSVKHLLRDESPNEKHGKGKLVSGKVSSIEADKLYIDIGEGDKLKGVVYKQDISTVRDQQDTSRFKVEDKITGIIKYLDTDKNELTISIKEQQRKEEKKSIENYKPEKVGTVLGDIFNFDKTSASSTPEKSKEDTSSKKTTQDTEAKSDTESK